MTTIGAMVGNERAKWLEGFLSVRSLARSTMRTQASAFWSLRLLILSGLTIVVLAAYPKTASGVEEQTYAVRRAQMIRTIETRTRDTSSALGHDHIDTRVLEVMGTIPRHEFVPEDLREASYEDRPLPIGFGQTISQPLIVALMTDIMNVDWTSVVLEVGTGSGYQAAVAAALARQVYTIEIIPELAHRAADRLHYLGYINVTVRVGDGISDGRTRAHLTGSLSLRLPLTTPTPTARAEAGSADGSPCGPAIRPPAPHSRGA